MRVVELVLALAVCVTGADWQRLWKDGARAEAIDALAADVAQHPGDRALRRQLAECEVAVHRYVAALEHMQPLGEEVRALRGVACFRVGDYANALDSLTKDDPLEALMRIDALETLGRFAESDAELEQARTRSDKGDARLFACDGRRLLRLERPADAVAAFRAAVELDPWNGEALFGLGRALMASGAREEAIAVLKRHRDLVPKLDGLEFARRSIDLAPAHAPNYTALGDAERELGRFALAEDAYKTAGRLATCAELVPNALRYARLFTEDLNDPKKAIDLLVACAERCPDARLFVRAGDLQRGLSRPREALALYTRAQRLRPEDPEIKARIEQVKK